MERLKRLIFRWRYMTEHHHMRDACEKIAYRICRMVSSTYEFASVDEWNEIRRQAEVYFKLQQPNVVYTPRTVGQNDVPPEDPVLPLGHVFFRGGY